MTEKEESDERPSAQALFETARNFMQANLGHAMHEGRIEPTVAVDIFNTFCSSFYTIINIARDGRRPTDAADVAYSALTIMYAASAAISRDVSGWTKGQKRAAHARKEKNKKSASTQIGEETVALALQHLKPGESLFRSGDRSKVAERIKPPLDLKIKELLLEGFVDAKPLSVDAIKKRLLRWTAIKPSDG